VHTHAGFHRFARGMIALRKAHPSLGRSRFWRADVAWSGPDGGPPDLQSGRLAMLLRGASQGDEDICALVNGEAEGAVFSLPPGRWRRVVDTGRASPDDLVEGGGTPVAGPALALQPRSIILLVGEGR
jgi:glycogen operon protein